MNLLEAQDVTRNIQRLVQNNERYLRSTTHLRGLERVLYLGEREFYALETLNAFDGRGSKEERRPSFQGYKICAVYGRNNSHIHATVLGTGAERISAPKLMNDSNKDVPAIGEGDAE